ncbi:MAG TPA: phosphoribosylaminoimidazolesuccinocarboxamide synthase [Candidatus Limnocylindrales bacterium]|nr:phosphoribosylaminoimidazolesuccinocarboxamide synthase [Candidatus Limnocylindrales bacterium]
MSPASALAGSFIRSGKVRDLYALGDDRLLLVASDRLSAFDVVLPTPIPDKGRVLTGLSRFWFDRTSDLIENHLVGVAPEEVPGGVDAETAAELRGRIMLCRRVQPLPIEVIVRGYLAGSGWKDYGRTGAVCGIALPAGLRESDRLPEPLFTPSTKAEEGHDENISLDQAAELVGRETAERVADLAIAIYRRGAEIAEPQGVILADTKFEFGIDPATGELILIDEVLTPDSSRFWDASVYEPGRAQASFDKQFVRDWLETQDWAKTPPGPELPAAVVDGTRERYVEAFERITGSSFARYLADDSIGGVAGAER